MSYNKQKEAYGKGLFKMMIEEHVREDHPYRKLLELVDCKKIARYFRARWSPVGRNVYLHKESVNTGYWLRYYLYRFMTICWIGRWKIT